MAGLLEELRRRNVIRVAIGYGVLAWVVLQITDLVAPALHLPDWTLTLVTFLGIVGFPFALFFAWAFELTPEGLKRSEDVTAEDSITHHTAGSINRVIIALLVVALAILLADRHFGWSQLQAPLPAVEEAATEPVPEPDAGDAGGPARSIAVLPFVNMSDDPAQDYFSDGISEELLNALAKIRELRVAARTSSFAFKGQNQDITAIAEALKVETVLEGSVRKAGPRVRITAQLINAGDGYHLWSETYDRDLTDIFAVQDEISAAIVEALKVHLAHGDAPVATRQVDLQAYNWFLQGRENVRDRTRASLELSLAQFQRALEIEPDYAEAWTGMAMATLLLVNDQYGDLPVEQVKREATEYLDRALASKPDLAAAHAARGLLYVTLEDNVEALRHLERAIALNPSEGVYYLWLRHALVGVGREADADEAIARAYLIDPLHPSIRIVYADLLIQQGDQKGARALVVPGSLYYYLVEWRIALEERRLADMWTLLDEAESQLADQLPRLNQQRAATLLFWLAEPQRALEYGAQSGGFELPAMTVLDPAALLARWPEAEWSTLEGQDLFLVVAALGALQRHEAVAGLLAGRDFAPYGDPDNGNNFQLAQLYAENLALLGRTEEARTLAAGLLEQVRKLQETRPSAGAEAEVGLRLVLGDADGAVARLRQLFEERPPSWLFFRFTPSLALLESREEVLQLQQQNLDFINRERAKLGWPPAAPYDAIAKD